MHECRKCEAYGLTFRRDYPPEEFLEGSSDAKVWIVGLNPAVEPRPEATAPAAAFGDLSKIHSYFRDFAIVSPRVFEGLGRKAGTAHTDLVKCASNSWPPQGVKGSDRAKIIANCETFLLDQIRKHRPSVIICNGAEASAAIKRALPPSAKLSLDATSYFTLIDGSRIAIVLSGFIGRIDHYSKRRLGREIESLLDEMGL